MAAQALPISKLSGMSDLLQETQQIEEPRHEKLSILDRTNG